MYSSHESSASALSLCLTTSSITAATHNHLLLRRTSTLFTDGAHVCPSATNSEAGSICSDGSTAHRRRFVFGTPTSQAGSFDEILSIKASKIGLVSDELGVSPLRDSRGTPVWMGSNSRPNSDFRLRLDEKLRRSSLASMRVLRGSPSSDTDNFSADLRDIADYRCNRLRPRSRLNSATNDGGSDMQPDDDEISLGMALGSAPLVESADPIVPRRSSSGSRFREEIVFPTKPENPLQWFRQLSQRTIRRTSMEIPGLFRNRPSTNDRVMITFAVPKKFFKFRSLKRQDQLPPVVDVPSDERPLKTFAPRDSPMPKRVGTQVGSAAMSPIDEAASGSLQVSEKKPPSRLTSLRDAVGKGFNSHLIRDHNLIPRMKHDHITLPPRASTAPPGHAQYMELEFLTTEATGLTTPPSPPTFDPRNIGGQRLSPSTERGYFDQHDMIQSQPRFPGPGDPPDVEASPWEHVFHSTGPPTPVTIYPNVNAVAPFLEQDKEIERRSAELIQRPRSSMSISRHFRNSWSSRRLTELSTDHVQRPGSTPPILPGETRVPTKLPDSPGAASARFEPVTTRGKLSLSMWLKKKQMETGVDYSDRPIDVQLERMRREERDTGVIGLTPKEELEVSSLSEESISYAAAVREIAGLERHPKARKRRGSMMKGANEEKGVEVLMG